jgi:hypothetical protein
MNNVDIAVTWPWGNTIQMFKTWRQAWLNSENKTDDKVNKHQYLKQWRSQMLPKTPI